MTITVAPSNTIRIVRTWTAPDGTVTRRRTWTAPLDRVGHDCIVTDGSYLHIGAHVQPDGLTMRTSYSAE